MKIVYSASFRKSYKKFTKGNSPLQKKIDAALRILAENPRSSGLQTHKLSGNLLGFYACSCGYDCRIVFSVEENQTTREKSILLIDVGTHEEVY